MAAGAAVLSVTLAGPAPAATVELRETVVVFEAGPGESNDAFMTGGSGTISIRDSHPIRPGAGCREAPNEYRVECTGVIGSVDVRLADEDDHLHIEGFPATAYGGAGDDDLQTGSGGSPVHFDGGPGDDRVDGGEGDDVLVGGTGNNFLRAAGGDDELIGGSDSNHMAGGGGDDVLRGGDGYDFLFGNDEWTTAPGSDDDVLLGGGDSDSLNGGPGADELLGGEGRDVVEYGGHVLGIHADVEGDADDGAPGEGDRIGADVESLGGGDGDDELIGDTRAGSLSGGRGDDTLVGGLGGDWVLGGEGDDLLFGDTPDGGPASPAATNADNLSGGPGDDRLSGGGGEDGHDGGEGDDVLDAREPPGAPVRSDDAGCDRRYFHGRVVYDENDAFPCEGAACEAGTDEALIDDPSDTPHECERINGEDFGPQPPVGGGWGAPVRLAPAPWAMRGPAVGITSLGVALATWGESTTEYLDPQRLVATALGPIGGREEPQELEPEVPPVEVGNLATDARGGALVAWTDPRGRVHAAYRGPAGAWQPATAFDAGVDAWPATAMSPEGTGAVAWVRKEPGRRVLEVAVRLAGGAWLPPRALAAWSDSAPDGNQLPVLDVTDAGDVHVLWNEGPELLSGGIRATGEPFARETLSDYGHPATLALDRAGNAVAMWTQGLYGSPAHGRVIAERPAGGMFGEPQVPPGGPTERTALAVDASGRKTVAAADNAFDSRLDRWAGRVHVSSSRFGEPLAEVATFRTTHWGPHPAVAVSPGGNAVVSWPIDDRQSAPMVASWRKGDGPFGPVEDVGRYCFQGGAVVAITDTGRAVTGFDSYMAVGTAAEGPPRQRCAPAAYYEPVAADPDPPQGPGGGAEPPPSIGDAPAPVPPAPRPPRTAAAAGSVKGLALRRRGRRLIARVRIACPVSCTARGALTLTAGTSVVARGRVAPRTFQGTRTISVPLRRLRRQAFTSSRRRRELRASLTLAAAGALRHVRAATPIAPAPRR